MSDSTPSRTPSSVERMSSTSSAKSGGMGGMLTILLVVACVALIGACFYISSGKQALQTKLDETTIKYNDTMKMVEVRDSTILSNTKICWFSLPPTRTYPTHKSWRYFRT